MYILEIRQAPPAPSSTTSSRQPGRGASGFCSLFLFTLAPSRLRPLSPPLWPHAQLTPWESGSSQVRPEQTPTFEGVDFRRTRGKPSNLLARDSWLRGFLLRECVVCARKQSNKKTNTLRMCYNIIRRKTTKRIVSSPRALAPTGTADGTQGMAACYIRFVYYIVCYSICCYTVLMIVYHSLVYS